MEEFNFVARQSKYNSWVSRDYKEIKCLAIGCKYNKEEFCMVPSRMKFDENAKCSGFEAKEFKKVMDGD